MINENVLVVWLIVMLVWIIINHIRITELKQELRIRGLLKD